MSTKKDSSEMLTSLSNEIALAEAKHEPASRQVHSWADRLRTEYRAQTAARLRELVPTVEAEGARPIRPEFLAMGRDYLIARLGEIMQRMGGTIQVAHRNLTELSDHDLRQLLEVLACEVEAITPRPE